MCLDRHFFCFSNLPFSPYFIIPSIPAATMVTPYLLLLLTSMLVMVSCPEPEGTGWREWEWTVTMCWQCTMLCSTLGRWQLRRAGLFSSRPSLSGKEDVVFLRIHAEFILHLLCLTLSWDCFHNDDGAYVASVVSVTHDYNYPNYVASLNSVASCHNIVNTAKVLCSLAPCTWCPSVLTLSVCLCVCTEWSPTQRVMISHVIRTWMRWRNGRRTTALYSVSSDTSVAGDSGNRWDCSSC